MTLVRGKGAAPPDNDLDGFLTSRERERIPWLLAFLCTLAPVLPSDSVPPGPLKSNGSPARLITMAMLALVVVAFILLRRHAAKQTLRPGVLVLLTYFFAQLLVYGVGLTEKGYTPVEASKTRAIIAVSTNVGLALYVLVRIRTAREISILLGCFAVGITFNNLAGILQSFTDINLHLFFQPPGFIVNTPEEDLGTTDELNERFGAIRALGTSRHPIEYSVFAAVAVPLTLHFARYAANRQTRVFAAIGACAALFAVPAAISRTGVIALGVAMFIYMWGAKLRAIAAAALIGGLAFVLQLAIAPNVIDALWQTIVNSAEDDSVLARVADYAKVAETFHERPIFGVGLGAAPPSQYGFLDNDWLQAIVQGGLVGLAAMAVLYAGAIFGMAAGLRGAQSPRERDQAYAMVAMMAGIMSSSLTFDLFSYQQVTFLFFVLFGLLWCRFVIPYGEYKIRRRVGAVIS